jgi:hypothetical protein
MGQGASNLGQKIREGFSWVGNKVKEGWGHVKNFGKKVWEGVKRVPVLGSIARGIEASPIGTGFKILGTGLDTAINAGGDVLRGDLKGAVSGVTSGGRAALGHLADDKVFKAVRDIPVLGTIAANAPIFGGVSYNTLQNVGGATLNAVDALKEGNVKGAITEGLKAGKGYLSNKTGNLGTAAKVIGGVETAVNLVGKK